MGGFVDGSVGVGVGGTLVVVAGGAAENYKIQNLKLKCDHFTNFETFRSVRL